MTELFLIPLGIGLLLGILSGVPVAFVLIGFPAVLALFASLFGAFDLGILAAFPSKAFGLTTNPIFLSVPLFVLMGGVLERSDIARRMMTTAGAMFGDRHGGMAIAIVIVGALLAASTGVIGATIFMLGMIAAPAMLNAGYSKSLTSGVICASGSLGQIIPPSILLILLTDQISSAYQAGRRAAGDWAPIPVTVGDLFAGALLPGLLLVALYVLYVLVVAKLRPSSCPPVRFLDDGGAVITPSRRYIAQSLLMPLVLILIVLGSILMGVATATESAALGAAGALVMAALENKNIAGWKKVVMISVLPAALLLVMVKFAGGAQAGMLLAVIGAVGLVVMFGGTVLALWQEHAAGRVMPVARDTASLVAMLVLIVLGAAMLSLVFRGFHGEELVRNFLQNLPGGIPTAIVFTMIVIFLLGFIIEYVEIIFIVIPIVGPPLMELGVDPVWFAILISMNLQMSFLTPPFGYALFYFRRIAPSEITTGDIYRGIFPFVCLQLAALVIVALVPAIATWLPHIIYN